MTPPERSEPGTPPADSGAKASWGVALKWIGGVTAVLSLFFASREFIGLITDRRARAQEVHALLAAAELQASHGEYRLGWASLDRAATLNAESDKVEAARENLAMQWLEDAKAPSDGAGFSVITDTVMPVLTRGAVTTSGRRRADLLAHLGWAAFLKRRSDGEPARITAYYDSALAAYPGDAYAHAMLGHWLLWNHRPLDSAVAQFAAAVAADSARAFVRRLQLAAFANEATPEADREFLRVAGEMRTGGEKMSPEAVDHAWQIYWACFIRSGPECEITTLIGSRSPADHLDTFVWIFANTGYPESKGVRYEYVLARLEEAAGRNDQAAAAYRLLATRLPANEDILRGKVAAGIRRLAPPR